MVSDRDELDGWALWQEHRPQDAEDWVEVAKRCAADEDFDITKSRPVFGAAVLLALEVMRLEFLMDDSEDDSEDDPDCPHCGHNGRVEPRSTTGVGWECFGCGAIWTSEGRPL